MAEVENVDDSALDDEELDGSDEMEDYDMDASIFWTMKIPAAETVHIAEPQIPNYMIHVTKACFGPQIVKGTRTVVMCGADLDEEGNPEYAPVCVLGNHTENVALNLMFNQDAVFKLEGNKPCDVWLTGHLQPDFETTRRGDDDGADYLSELHARDGEFEMDDEDSKGVLMSLDEGDDDESPEVAPAQKKRKLNDNKAAKVTAKQNNNNNNNNKNKKSPKNKPAATPDNNQSNGNSKQSKKQQKQKKDNEPKQTQQQEGKKKNKKKKKQKMAGGIEYKDVTQGTGPGLKKGDRVSVYYCGQLASNDKIFDKKLNGDGFAFTLGAGEVIKGWDMGLMGMKGVGAKRKLWVPPKLGYGNQSQPGIPPNSTLVFTIQVKKVE